MNQPITAVTADIIRNSRGHQTIAVTVHAGQFQGTFAVPEGASTGSKEVAVLDAQASVVCIQEKVAPALLGVSVTDQVHIDGLLHALDTTERFTHIGGNVALGVSVAAIKAAAAVHTVPLWKEVQTYFSEPKQAVTPRLFVNLINGGKHAPYGSPIQEHQIVPQTDDVEEAYFAACSVKQELLKILVATYGEGAVQLGDEGGFVIPSKTLFEPFTHIKTAIQRASLSIPISLSCDIAASSFFADSAYHVDGVEKNVSQMMELYTQLIETFPELIAIEDPFFESDFEAFALCKKTFPQLVVIGDDLTTTNNHLLQKAISHDALSGIIIKPNQIGTVTDTLTTMRTAFQENVSCVVSHRSGETLDDFIADLAFATGAYGLKAGAPHAVEREPKYQRLITIAK